MSKHANLEYVRKPLSKSVVGKGFALVALGLAFVVFGLMNNATYTGPENNHEKTEKERIEIHRLQKEALANRLTGGHYHLEIKAESSHGTKAEAAHGGHEVKAEENHGAGHDAVHGHVSTGPTQFSMSYRIWSNVLILFLFLLSVGAGSLFLIGLEHLVGAKWSAPFRRVTELMCFVMWPAAIIGLIIYFFGLDTLYDSWVNNPEKDAFIAGKAAYLNKTGFLIRYLCVFAFWGFFYWFFIRNSKAQDNTNDQKYTRLSAKLAPIFIIVNSFAITVIAIDFIMSLSPKWYSTMFGVAYFGGSVMAALAATIFASVRLKEGGFLHPRMVNDSFYSLAGLLFGFNCFWAYVSFSQFMLIWYSNLPEETFWFLLRWNGNWMWFTLAMIVIHFVVPLILLISRSAKTNLERLKLMSVWLLVAHYIDMYWQVVPTFSNTPFIGLVEVGFLLISLGLLVAIFAIKGGNVNHVPVGDPKLEIGLSFRLH